MLLCNHGFQLNNIDANQLGYSEPFGLWNFSQCNAVRSIVFLADAIDAAYSEGITAGVAVEGLRAVPVKFKEQIS